ncbi:hypothetical protein TELCIR_10658 [Teladorsagia circumcincta]|uniref:Uncharacterized protein n=1 Tax=Teladorsagia circumcincta TaxID=45464 RepID=A0A2G9UBJ3_TELCI|nr:hypothetical protein TELCIR_10658 [Teladorsagia circumcincta]
MVPLPLTQLSRRSFFSIREERVIETLRSLDPKTFYCTVDGEIVADFLGRLGGLPEDGLFQLHFRVLGGKGGFGSLLRSFRVNKSTNQLMCRDLNGRRLASIDEEERLKKWIERMAEREKEKIAKRKAKYEKLKAGPPKHMFNDTDYMRQKETIIEKTEEAFEEGFVEALKAEREKKEKPAESSEDEDDDSSSDSEENDVDPELLREIQEYFTTQNGESSKSLQDEKPTTEPTEFPAVDLSLYDSAVQLEELGLNHLKHALAARGMKCGGTLRQRAERLFSAKKNDGKKT